MRKILIANDLLKGGGVEAILKELVLYLKKKDYEIWLVIPDCTQAEVVELFGAEINFMRCVRPSAKISRFVMGRYIYKMCSVLCDMLMWLKTALVGFDVAIALKEGPIMRNTTAVCAKKKFAWIHSDYNLMHWTKTCFRSNEYECRCMAKFDKTVCVSKAVADSVVNTIGDPGNLCVRYNPINALKIYDLAKEECHETCKTDVPLFVSVGRLAYPKNYDMLIDVCCELSRSYSFETWIIGDGPDREALQNKIDQQKVECVRLLGNKENPFPYLRQAEVFISSSLCESYGLAVQEALLLGIPVIAVECPAIAETLDTRFGILCDPSIHSMKEAMEQFLQDSQKIRNYRNCIHEHYLSHDVYENRLEEILQLWEDDSA